MIQTHLLGLCHAQGVLDRVTLKNGGTGAPEEVLAMRNALQRSQDDVALLRNKLEQKHAELELLGVSSEKQVGMPG